METSAGDEQLEQRRYRPADNGEDGEHPYGKEQHRLPAQHIAELCVDDEEAGVGEQIRRHDPVTLVEAA